MRFENWLSLAIHGPAHFRFLVQPLVAIFLGWRDGRLDARAGRPPYFLSLFRSSPGTTRSANLKEGLQHAAVPLTVGIVLDLVVQFVLLHRIYLITGILVGVLLVALPYAFARGLFNRMVRHQTRPGRQVRHA
jgi:hypothetical protein